MNRSKSVKSDVRLRYVKAARKNSYELPEQDSNLQPSD